MLIGHCSTEAQFLEDFQGLFYCCTKTMNFLEMWQWCQKWFPQFHQKVLPANRILWSMKKGPKSCQKVGSQINPFFICRNSTNHKMIFSYFRKETKHLPIFPSIKNHSSLPRNKSSLWQRVFWLFSINLLALKRCYIARLVRRNERVKRFNFYPEIPLTTVMPKIAQSFAV